MAEQQKFSMPLTQYREGISERFILLEAKVDNLKELTDTRYKELNSRVEGLIFSLNKKIDDYFRENNKKTELILTKIEQLMLEVAKMQAKNEAMKEITEHSARNEGGKWGATLGAIIGGIVAGIAMVVKAIIG